MLSLIAGTGSSKKPGEWPGTCHRLQPSDTPAACWAITTSLARSAALFMAPVAFWHRLGFLIQASLLLCTLGCGWFTFLGSNPSLPHDSAKLVPTPCSETVGWGLGIEQLGGCRSGQDSGHESGGVQHGSPSITGWLWLSHFPSWAQFSHQYVEEIDCEV